MTAHDGCEWDPATDSPAGDESDAHFRATRAEVLVGADGQWRLCLECSKLPNFKRFRTRKTIAISEGEARAALDSQEFLGWTDADWEKVPDRDAFKGQLPPEVAERLRRNGEEALATVRKGLADLGEVPEMSPKRARALLEVGLKRQGLI